MDWKSEKEKKSRKEKWSVLLLLLMLFLLGIVIGILFSQKRNCCECVAQSTVSSDNISGGVGLAIDPNAENSSSYENNHKEEQGVSISGWDSMTIPANEKEIPVDFYNPKENEGLYYLTFELRIYNNNESYEVLYTSGLVEPGKHINQITISHGLEKGMYKAVVHVQPYRMDEDKTITNNSDIKIKLIVQ